MKKGLLLFALVAVLAVPASADGYIPVTTETFAYVGGNLNTVGAPRWSGNATTEIQVTLDETCAVYVNPNAYVTSSWTFGAFAGQGGKAQFRVFAKTGAASPAGNIYNLWVYDSLGNSARWYGPATAATGRTSAVTSAAQLSTTAWTQLDMIFDFTAHTATCYANGVKLGGTNPLPINAAMADIAKFTFESWDRDDTVGHLYFDDLSYGYVPEPSSLLALSAFGIGMLGYIKRRR